MAEVAIFYFNRRDWLLSVPINFKCPLHSNIFRGPSLNGSIYVYVCVQTYSPADIYLYVSVSVYIYSYIHQHNPPNSRSCGDLSTVEVSPKIPHIYIRHESIFYRRQPGYVGFPGKRRSAEAVLVREKASGAATGEESESIMVSKSRISSKYGVKRGLCTIKMTILTPMSCAFSGILSCFDNAIRPIERSTSKIL